MVHTMQVQKKSEIVPTETYQIDAMRKELWKIIFDVLH